MNKQILNSRIETVKQHLASDNHSQHRAYHKDLSNGDIYNNTETKSIIPRNEDRKSTERTFLTCK